MQYDSIGTRLRAHRTARQLSLSQLARRSGVGLHQIHKYEREDHEPTVRVLKRLAEALDTDLDALVP
jgi:transcriptional regulator with XRE-family HTH domain